MSNSRIKYKPCKYSDCKFPPKFGAAGYCSIHEHDNSPGEKKTSWYNKKKNVLPVKLTAVVPDYQPAELQQWFADAASQLLQFPYCMNCNAEIAFIHFEAACCHILPKRKPYGFPSVATHPLNRIFLGSACGCHQKFDRSWEDAAKMNVWPLVLVAMETILPYIAPGELKNLPGILRKKDTCAINTPS